jgi:hypothetical protein
VNNCGINSIAGGELSSGFSGVSHAQQRDTSRINYSRPEGGGVEEKMRAISLALVRSRARV